MAGLFQVLQSLLALGVTVQVFPGAGISAGSIVVFPATLFAILLIYVLEDEREARRLIYGVLLANLALAILIAAGQPLLMPAGANHLGIDAAFASRLSRIVLFAAVLLAIDAFILIRSFEWFGERVSRNSLLRAQFAMGLTIAFDASLFWWAFFQKVPLFGLTLAVCILGRMGAAVFYSLAFSVLLPWSRYPLEGLGLTLRGTKDSLTYKERFQALQKIAVRDALTGVFNRAYFDHELRAQTERALLRGDRLLLLLLDLDSFKKVNDTHGHPTGDRVLALFGEALRKVARQNDTVCRYGGEEFAILIAGGPVTIAPVLMERVKDEFATLWQSATPPLAFAAPRFSMGAAAVSGDARSAEELLARADQRLYASKRAGGDRLTTTSAA
jgi:diguanylate cyclase (GGDEF)-like protein